VIGHDSFRVRDGFCRTISDRRVSVYEDGVVPAADFDAAVSRYWLGTQRYPEAPGNDIE
jgi:hypothetical protein